MKSSERFWNSRFVFIFRALMTANAAECSIPFGDSLETHVHETHPTRHPPQRAKHAINGHSHSYAVPEPLTDMAHHGPHSPQRKHWRSLTANWRTLTLENARSANEVVWTFMKFKICLYFWGVFGPWRGSVASYTTDERAKNGQKERWRLNLEEIKLQIKSSSEKFRRLQ